MSRKCRGFLGAEYDSLSQMLIWYASAIVIAIGIIMVIRIIPMTDTRSPASLTADGSALGNGAGRKAEAAKAAPLSAR